MSRSAVETFLRTLILGDFEENQSTSAQIVSGLLGLIPGLDQVLDARDITGTLFNINKSGGFKHATSDQLVNLGFAAFGAIPEVGSVFKATFKPLYRERKLAKGAVHSGIHKLESMLHMEKGAALTWIRKELLGKWAQRTNQVIQTVNAALNSAIQMVEFMATASGWKDWLIPDPIQDLCKQLLPGLKAMRGQLDSPLRRASDEIRHFLEDLIGEQAAGVVMALGGRAAQASAVPGSRTRSGHNAAAVVPKGKVPTRQPQKKVGGTPQTHGSKAQGPVSAAIQKTRNAVTALAQKEMGIVGEHLADYHCQDTKGWGVKAAHDHGAVNSAKLNDDARMVQLFPVKIRGRGIDAVWKSNGPKAYAIIEAKASVDPTKGLASLLGDANDKSGSGGGGGGTLKRRGGTGGQQAASPDNARQSNGKVTQMSHGWIQQRLKTIRLTDQVALKDMQLRERASYSRHVMFFSIPQTVAHAEALARLVLSERIDPSFHGSHETTREWGDAAIEKVVDNRAGFVGEGRDARNRVRKTK